MSRSLSVIGLFAGIGGIEQGLRACGGFHAELLCEIDPGARRILSARFKDVPLRADIRSIRRLPTVDLRAHVDRSHSRSSGSAQARPSICCPPPRLPSSRTQPMT
jgi:hypothetical protein